MLWSMQSNSKIPSAEAHLSNEGMCALNSGILIETFLAHFPIRCIRTDLTCFDL